MYYNKKKLAVSILWVVVGITLIVLECLEIIGGSIWSGMGGGLVAVGILQVVRNIKYNSSEEYKEKVDIEATDERNRYIRMKAWSWAGYIFVICAAVVSIVFFVLGRTETGSVISYCMCSILALFWGSYLVLKNKY